MLFGETFIEWWWCKILSPIWRYGAVPMEVFVMNWFFWFETFRKISKIGLSHKNYNICPIVNFNEWTAILVNWYVKLIIEQGCRCSQWNLSIKAKGNLYLIKNIYFNLFSKSRFLASFEKKNAIQIFTLASCGVVNPNAVRMIGLLIEIGAAKLLESPSHRTKM